MPFIVRTVDVGTRPLVGALMEEAQAYPRLAELGSRFGFTYYALERLLLIGCDRVLTADELGDVEALLAAHAGAPD